MSKELKDTIERERALYIPHIKSLTNKLMARYTHAEEYRIFRYICALRRAEYYQNRSKHLYVFWIRRANILGESLGFSIPAGVLGEGVLLYHPGVVINLESEIGAGCRFHGDNCVGNNGKDNLCPILGKPVVITAYPTSGSQLHDGTDGIIVPIENERCVEGIVRVLRDKALMNELKKIARH